MEKEMEFTASRTSLQQASRFPQDDASLFPTISSRRNLFQDVVGITTSGLVVASAVTSVAGLSLPSSAQAAEASEIFLRLRSIPTFCIVNSDGVPFMIFDGQASATGYFFLSFQVASQALSDARQKDKNQGATEVWSRAKIIVVPLAVALQLTLRKTQREAVNTSNGIKFNTYNDIVPAQEGVDDAKALDVTSPNPGKWEQKGRVPLFYISELRLSDGREPRYFNQQDLLNEWERQHPGSIASSSALSPKIRIVEMGDLFRTAFKTNNLELVDNLAIMPVAESNQVARKLVQEGGGGGGSGSLPKYDFNKVYLVGSAQG